MIRKANSDDALSIQRLIHIHAQKGQMLPRSFADISANIRNFYVFEKSGVIVGTCALNASWSVPSEQEFPSGPRQLPRADRAKTAEPSDALVEVRSLAVHPGYLRQGIGTALIERCIEDAASAAKDKIFVLTYSVSLFRRLGFEVVDKSDLPMKIWNDCRGCSKSEFCDETAMVRPLRPPAVKVLSDYPLRNADKVVYL